MRVLINAASAHMGGSVTYLQNVLQWLPQVAPSDDFVVYVPEATLEKLADLSSARVQLRAYPHDSTQGVRRLYFDQIELGQILRREAVDVLFSATGFGTFWSPCPQVLLVRNMAYFDPQFHARYRALGRSLSRNTLRRWHSLLSIQRTDAVLFPTEAIRDVVGRYVSVSGKKTKVLPYGFDRDRFFAEGIEEPDIAAHMRRWKAAGTKILLSVSTYAVHKNFETLVEALPRLRASGLPVRLVTTTSRERTADKEEYDALQRRAAALGVKEYWTETGYVAYDQLQHLYRQADAYVFPSFTESFGHSLVEAMASGRPVIAADTDVNREVCGTAGTFFEPFDAEDCARKIEEVLSDERQQEKLKQASSSRAADFSWQEYTEQLVSLFRSIARQERRRVEPESYVGA